MHPNYHHQITYAKFNLKNHIPVHTNEKYDIMKKLIVKEILKITARMEKSIYSIQL